MSTANSESNKNTDSVKEKVSANIEKAKDLETPESAKKKMMKLENDMIEKQNQVEVAAAERDKKA